MKNDTLPSCALCAHFNYSRIIAGLLAIVIVAIDQLTKTFVIKHLSLHETLPVFPGFDLTYRRNPGAAFSFLADASGWQRWLFVGLALVISTVIWFWLGKLKKTQRLESWGLGLILGGALGNVLDRLLHGFVIDFLLFYYRSWEWPAFNVADMAITCGAILVAWSIFKNN